MDNIANRLNTEDIKLIDNNVSNIHSKVIDIMRTQNYQILREEDFTNKQIINSKVLLYLTIIQIFLVVIFTFWQASSLKKLFVDFISKQ